MRNDTKAAASPLQHLIFEGKNLHIHMHMKSKR